MDTSETYIKMCEKATELQEVWDIRFGDFHCGKGETEVLLLINRPEDRGNDYIIKSFGIWLPRQDQLQEMVQTTNEYNLAEMEMRFHEWCVSPLTVYTQTHKHLTSMEQLWLAFVMKEEYNKVWNGEGWVS